MSSKRLKRLWGTPCVASVSGAIAITVGAFLPGETFIKVVWMAVISGEA
jgi:hypothetical protein